jgi:hypothetical protein
MRDVARFCRVLLAISLCFPWKIDDVYVCCKQSHFIFASFFVANQSTKNDA